MHAALLMSLLALASPAVGSPAAHATWMAGDSVDVDGAWTDDVWRRTAWVEGFVQQEPTPGEVPTERTRVKIAYDAAAIYIVVDALDSDVTSIHSRLTRRDEPSASDWVHVWLDTFDDGRSAYRFSVNPSGVKQDARVGDEGEDVEWDAVWEAGVRTSTSGWSAELRIPLAELRYGGELRRWGVQLARHISRRGETSYFSATPPGTDAIVRYFGSLHGLEKLPSTWALSLEPYALGSARLDADGAQPGATGGGEARLALGAGMKLSLSVNPDFGYVESDPSLLSLGSAEVFIPEKRRFFLEGQELLDYPLGFGVKSEDTNLFYSRRIGRNAPILASLKLVGKTDNGWSVGIVDAVTGEGSVADAPEPLGNALAARVVRSSDDDRTTVGMMGTYSQRSPDGADQAILPSQALSGGFDFGHRVDDFELIVRAYWSQVRGTAEAMAVVQQSSVHYFQRPDAPHLALAPDLRSMSGWGATVVAGKTSGSAWRGGVAAMFTSPGFDPNALGYLPRSDDQQVLLWGQLREDEGGALHRNWRLDATAWAHRTGGGELTSLGGELAGTWTFPNTSWVEVSFARDMEALDVSALFGGPALRRPGIWYATISGQTDERADVVLSGELYLDERDEDAGRTLGALAQLAATPAPSLRLSLEPTIEAHTLDHQWVDQQGELPVVGRLSQMTASLAVRADWTLTTELSVQVYAAAYLTAGTYTSFREVTRAAAAEYVEQFSATSYAGANRFRFGELRANAVIRWEYVLGSTLSLVWSHEQAMFDELRGTLDVVDDLGGLFGQPSSDTVLLKLSYWFAL